MINSTLVVTSALLLLGYEVTFLQPLDSREDEAKSLMQANSANNRRHYLSLMCLGNFRPEGPG